MNSILKSNLIGAAAVVGLVVVWKIVSIFIGSSIILPSPEFTLRTFVQFLAARDFWMAVAATTLRGLVGFFIAVVLGIGIGLAAGLNAVVYRLFQPLLTIIRSTPIMSIILLALIWFTSGSVPIFVSLLITFPVITGNVIDGVKNSDAELLEMARLYRVSKRHTMWHLILPSILPFVIAGSSTAMGLTWKVVVAAEVLSQPRHAIGTGLYESKIQLETAGVFAWTLVAIGLSFLFEGLIRWFEKGVTGWKREPYI